MLEIPVRIWKKVEGYTKPQKVFRTNHENVLCWKTLRKSDKKPVVIKLFEWEIVEHCADELRAAEILKKINHKHLVRVLDVVEDEEIGIYYVMEYWGEDLRDTIKVKADPKVALEITKQVLEGLAELHRHGLTHRDIKPENLYLKDGIVKLGDYGLVKSQRLITKLITIAGTRDYMAPEILEGKPYDHRCDIYSVGIVLLELLTQSTNIPKQRPNDIKELFWNKVILKAIAQDPNERFNSIDDFIKTFIEEVPYFDSFDLRRFYKKPKSLHKGTEKAEEKDTPLTPLNRGDSLSELSVSAVKPPLFQKLDIQRYPPKPEMRGQDNPGVLIKILQAKLDGEMKKSSPNYQALFGVVMELAQAVEKRFGLQNSRTADAFDKVAGILLLTENYKQSGEYYYKSLGIDKTVYGEHNRNYISSLYHLAMVRLAAQDYPAVKEYYKQALALGEKVWGKSGEHAILLNNFGCIHYLLKEYQEAINYLQEALSINEKQMGSNYQASVTNLQNLALVYEAMGNKGTAEALRQQADNITRQFGGHFSS